MSAVDVVIVNWNAGPQLIDVLSSIGKYHHGLVSSVTIVDNDSVDNSVRLVQAMQDLPLRLQIVENKNNHGFGKACNQGALLSNGEYLLFLNPDAALHADTLPASLNFMLDAVNAKVGICGVQLLDDGGHVSRSCARFPTALGFMLHAIGIDRVFPRLGHAMMEWDHSHTRQVDHVIGAFFLVRRELFNALLGFDERFFVYLEDLDFSYRARKAGWSSFYLANTQAFHSGGGTSNSIKARRLFYSLRSRVVFSFKHFSWMGAFAVLMATLLVEPWSRSSLSLYRRSWSGLRETCAAYGLLCRWLAPWVLKGGIR